MLCSQTELLQMKTCWQKTWQADKEVNKYGLYCMILFSFVLSGQDLMWLMLASHPLGTISQALRFQEYSTISQCVHNSGDNYQLQLS